MSAKPYLLLDAGGTFLFVDQDYLSGLADTHGFQVEARRFYEEHYHLAHWFDTYVSTQRRFLSRLSEPYSQILLRLVGLSEETAAQAAQLAQDADVRRLVLTHVSRRYREAEILEEARAIFPETVVARDFDHFRVLRSDAEDET